MLLESYLANLTEVPVAETAAEVWVAGLELVGTRVEANLDLLTFRRVGPDVQVALRHPLGDADGYWQPTTQTRRSLPPDWAGTQRLSVVSSSPMGVTYDASGMSIFGYAFDALTTEGQLQFGVSEEWKSFVVLFEQTGSATPDSLTLALVREPQRYSRAVAQLRDWLRACVERDSLPLAPAATVPVYSTWYAYSQRIHAAQIEQDAAIAKRIGCGAVFIDDGWQRYGDGRWYAGCGDWQPDTEKFADLAGLVKRLRAQDLAVVLWIAPLLLGEQSNVFATLSHHAPHQVEHLRCHVLDPRVREVREHIVATCLRLMVDYGIDGLKIDFLEQAMHYAGTPSPGDVDDVGTAMQLLLEQIRDAARTAGIAAPLIEYRQPYIGPATAVHGNVLRADDCPADAAVNRRSIAEVRLLATTQVVHSDPVMWDHRAGPAAANRQLLGGFFAVPQVSMPLSALPTDQLDHVASVLGAWSRARETLLFGQFDAGLPTEGVPFLLSETNTHAVLGVYHERMVDLPAPPGLTLVNASPADQVLLRSTTPARGIRLVRDAAGNIVDRIAVSIVAGLNVIELPSGGIAEFEIERMAVA